MNYTFIKSYMDIIKLTTKDPKHIIFNGIKEITNDLLKGRTYFVK